nr:DNA/RNA non-specific endonuclease [uncultured Carboxylicivirga sp.]
MSTSKFFLSIILFIAAINISAQQLKLIELHPDYNHDKYNTQPKDILRQFRAYTVSFDGSDDDNGDGVADYWRIPEWVSYEMKAMDDPGKGPKRPSKWITDKDLYEQGICANDDSYKYSSDFRKEHPNWYARGHMCMKLIAWRLGENADWNTHTMLNACPQREHNNAGIWLDMEYKTIDWADKYGQIWVICGPVITDKTPSSYIGEEEKGELPVAVPDAFFKIVVREEGGQTDPLVMAFIYPQDTERKDKDHLKYAVSVNEIERKTGLDFFTDLPKDVEARIEAVVVSEMWE